jgi:hypothetical protein
MSATNLEEYAQAARAQGQQEMLMRQAFQQALQKPHTIVRLEQIAVAIVPDPQAPARKLLMVATANGQRYDIPLGGPVAVTILKALSDEP